MHPAPQNKNKYLNKGHTQSIHRSENNTVKKKKKKANQL
jgi:hypothetical protein